MRVSIEYNCSEKSMVRHVCNDVSIVIREIDNNIFSINTLILSL